MQVFELATVAAQRHAAGRLYLEFLHVPTLSMGLYELPAGGTDPQESHTEDEVYFVTGGRAAITVDGEEQTVGPGSIVYVAATVPHRFHSITADLSLLVFFAPAEYSQTKG